MKDEEGQPVSDALIKVNGSVFVHTDVQGFFHTLLAPGAQQLQVQASGFREQLMQVGRKSGLGGIWSGLYLVQKNYLLCPVDGSVSYCALVILVLHCSDAAVVSPPRQVNVSSYQKAVPIMITFSEKSRYRGQGLVLVAASKQTWSAFTHCNCTTVGNLLGH